MNLLVPSSVMPSGGAVQFVVVRSALSCRFHPVAAEGQDTTAVLVVVRKILNSGAPGVCAET